MLLKTMLLQILTAFLVFGNIETKSLHDSRDPPCQTSDGSRGLCKIYRNCPRLSKPLDTLEFSRRFWHSQCSFEEKTAKVCCPLSSEDTIPAGNVPVVDVSLFDNDNCGISTENKIIGGNRTELGEFPWMAALEYKSDDDKRENAAPNIRCGGFLINNRYVLTAAHCINDSLINVRLGEYNLLKDPDCNDDGICVNYSKVFIQAKIPFRSYKLRPHKYHDIALLRLSQKITFTQFIRPICLPTTTGELFESYVSKKATVAGWGKTEHGNYDIFQLKVEIPVNALYECPRVNLDEGQLCAGDDGKGSCFADSGGPLMFQKRDDMGDVRWLAIGIVSGGPENCTEAYNPGHYVRVSKYMTWIAETIKP